MQICGPFKEASIHGNLMGTWERSKWWWSSRNFLHCLTILKDLLEFHCFFFTTSYENSHGSSLLTLCLITGDYFTMAGKEVGAATETQMFIMDQKLKRFSLSCLSFCLPSVDKTKPVFGKLIRSFFVESNWEGDLTELSLPNYNQVQSRFSPTKSSSETWRVNLFLFIFFSLVFQGGRWSDHKLQRCH
jgi:hypothetical protein